MLQIFLIILPIFLVILLGTVLFKTNLIDGKFINTSNNLLFSFLIPLLLFYNISQSNLSDIFNIDHVLVMIGSTVLMFLLGFPISRLLGLSAPAAASFTANAFRSNTLLIGLPVCFYVFGEQALAIGSILIAFAAPFNNILGVLAFSKIARNNWTTSLKSALVNPIVISCLLGMSFAFFNIPLPAFIDNTFSILNGITLPLALINIGANLNFLYFKRNTALIAINTFFKLFFLPAIAMLIYKLLNFGDFSIFEQIVILLLSSPTAQINYVFATSMEGDPDLASGVIAFSTLFSIISYTFWLILLM